MTQTLDPKLFIQTRKSKHTAVFPFTHGTNISEDMAQFFIMKAVYGKHLDTLTDEVITNYWPEHVD